MSSQRDQQIWALYRSALERPAGERASFVADLSGGDEELRRSVERLLSQQHATDVGARAVAQDLEASELLVGAQLGQYRIEGVLGRGGMGVVYRATDAKLQRSVAIKCLSSSVADAGVRRRFQQEAKTTTGLNHPHIVTVYDVGEHDGQQYIVSELVDGGTLDDWMTATPHRTWRQCVELLTGVADGLAAAHAAGVLHRDVKPGNILLGKNGYAKLADFGLAKLVDIGAPSQGELRVVSRDTRAGTVVGTIAYMSPEQAAGQPLDVRSDVFSFGIVLYELLAGRRPFEAANDLEVLKTIAHATPAPLPSSIPEILRIAVDKALEKDPADRYQTMRDLVADLRRVARKSASSQAVESTQSDAQLLAAIAARHRRVVVGFVAMSLVAVALGSYIVLSSLTRSEPAIRMTRVTTSGDAVRPAIHPDGQYVVYARLNSGDETPTSIWLRRLETPMDVPIVPVEAGFSLADGPTVKPDGNYVDFIGATAPADPPALWRVEMLGGTPRRLVDSVGSPVGWSPDGRHMAFVRAHSKIQRSELVVADPEGNDERVLAVREAPATFPSVFLSGRPLVRPVWSPDGRVIAVVEGRANEQSRVVFVDVETGAERVSDAQIGVVSRGLAWLGAGSLVMSQSLTLGERLQLWRISYKDGAISPVTNDLSNYVGVDVDVTRTRLVTMQSEIRTSVWVGDAQGLDSKQIVPSAPYVGTTPQISWAGERLLYDVTANGGLAVAAVDSRRGTLPVELLRGGLGFSATSDGRTIVFGKLGDGIWKTDSAGRQPARLAEGDAMMPVVTSDDRNVVFISNRSGFQTPWMVALAGGEATEVVHQQASVGSVDVSRDNRKLLFTSRRGENELVLLVCDFPACVMRKELEPPPNLSSTRRVVRWAPSGEEIAYVDSSGTNLWSLPLDGGTPRQTTRFPDDKHDGLIAAFSWSRDGERLAIVRVTTRYDVVLLRGLRP